MANERINWATYDRGPIPNQVAAGYGVISDPHVNKVKVTELYLLCESARNALCQPVEGRTRGPMVCGSLFPQIKGGELVLHQYTPYPDKRDDGVPHMTGQLIYPHLQNPGGWAEAAGTYYNKSTAKGAEMLKAVRVKPEINDKKEIK